MTTLDQTFLKPHWRTVEWAQQREQCAGCVHCVRHAVNTAGQTFHTTMRCGITSDVHAGPTGLAYCIDAREPGKPCGPTGALFQPKE